MSTKFSHLQIFCCDAMHATIPYAGFLHDFVDFYPSVIIKKLVILLNSIQYAARVLATSMW